MRVFSTLMMSRQMKTRIATACMRVFSHTQVKEDQELSKNSRVITG